MNNHDIAAAQQIIKALALPALSRASEPPRPMPLSHLPRLPRETSMLYTIGRVDPSGRVTNRGITDALQWQPGDRLAMTLTPSAVVLYPAPDGLLRVPPRPCIAYHPRDQNVWYDAPAMLSRMRCAAGEWFISCHHFEISAGVAICLPVTAV